MSGQLRWTRREYARMIDHGFLDEDDPVELLDGLLLVKEPQHSPHRTAVPEAGRPPPMPGRGSRTTGSSTWSIASSKSIVSPRAPAPP
jgi:hypothetical protein